MVREYKIKVAGILQRHRFYEKEEETAFGRVVFLVPEKKNLPELELLRIAKESGMPVKDGNKSFFPPGKMLKDFAKRN